VKGLKQTLQRPGDTLFAVSCGFGSTGWSFPVPPNIRRFSSSNQIKNCVAVRRRLYLDVVALQRLYKRLQDAIALWALNWRESRLQGQLAGEDLRVFRYVEPAIIEQHLDDCWRTMVAKAALNCLKHDVANVGDADSSVTAARQAMISRS